LSDIFTKPLDMIMNLCLDLHSWYGSLKPSHRLH
jgi:hypothetical protein